MFVAAKKHHWLQSPGEEQTVKIQKAKFIVRHPKPVHSGRESVSDTNSCQVFLEQLKEPELQFDLPQTSDILKYRLFKAAAAPIVECIVERD